MPYFTWTRNKNSFKEITVPVSRIGDICHGTIAGWLAWLAGVSLTRALRNIWIEKTTFQQSVPQFLLKTGAGEGQGEERMIVFFFFKIAQHNTKMYKFRDEA